MRTVRFVGVAIAALVTAATSSSALGGSTESAQAPQRIAVTASEYKFALKPNTARKGVVVFTVANRGTIGHDFRIRGKKTRAIGAGKRGTVRVSFTRAGRYPYLCTLPSHAPAGMRGVLIVR